MQPECVSLGTEYRAKGHLEAKIFERSHPKSLSFPIYQMSYVECKGISDLSIPKNLVKCSLLTKWDSTFESQKPGVSRGRGGAGGGRPVPGGLTTARLESWSKENPKLSPEKGGELPPLPPNVGTG